MSLFRVKLKQYRFDNVAINAHPATLVSFSTEYIMHFISFAAAGRAGKTFAYVAKLEAGDFWQHICQGIFIA